MPGSIEPTRCLIKANDSTNRLFFINCNSCSPTSFAVLILTMSPNSRVTREAKFQCTGSVIRRSKGGNSVVDRKPDGVQRENSNLTPHPSIDHNFRYLSSRLGAACQGQTTGGPWTAEEQKMKNHINILELKAAKLAILTFIYMHPEVKPIHLQMENIVGLSYVVKMGATHNKVLSDINKEIWDYFAFERDHNYCRVPTWGFESRSRFPVAVYERLEQIETKTTDFSCTRQYKGDTRHRSLCISSLPLTSLLYFLETGPIQQWEGCISKVTEIPKGVCFYKFQPNWKSVEESSNGPGPDLTGNSWQSQSWYSCLPSGVSKQTGFDSTSRGSFTGPKDGKASIKREREIKTSGLDNFREKLLQRESQRTLQSLSKLPKDKVRSLIMNQLGSRKQVDPISNSLNSVPDFLSELFNSGLEWSTIAGYRSSISAFHDLFPLQWVNTFMFALFFEGFLIKEQQFQDLYLHGVFRKCERTSKMLVFQNTEMVRC